MAATLSPEQVGEFHSHERRGQVWVKACVSCAYCNGYDEMWMRQCTVRGSFVKYLRKTGWKRVVGEWICDECSK